MLYKDRIIEELELQPHPEGGYFRETYRSDGVIKNFSLPDTFDGERNFVTCIYFLLTSEEFSAFHRIKQDEIWHFYLGATILLHIISREGIYSKIQIGTDIASGEIPQFVVKGGSWFAAEIVDKESFALIGCTVSPGFSFEDFELGRRKHLIDMFPKHSGLIERLTR